MECTLYVTLRRFRVSIFLQWKINKYYIFLVCTCSLRYSAYNACGPYCHVWPVWLCSIFPHKMRVLIFSKIFV